MEFWESYQKLPLLVSPTAFQVGFFDISWYAIMYFLAFLTIYALLKFRKKKGELRSLSFDILDFLVCAMLGALIGGRLGYVFYDWGAFQENLWLAISPYNFETGFWTGIYGMSYHGGFVGALLASWLFSYWNRSDFWQLAEFVIPAVPLGYFFGRIGNFLNGELYGKIIESRWGMNFGDGFLRLPNQLLEAFFEGLLIFTVLWLLRNNSRFRGWLLPIYIISYAVIRFLLDFLREPDGLYAPLGGLIAWSQIFSLWMLILGLLIYSWKKYRKNVIISK